MSSHHGAGVVGVVSLVTVSIWVGAYFYRVAKGVSPHPGTRSLIAVGISAVGGIFASAGAGLGRVQLFGVAGLLLLSAVALLGAPLLRDYRRLSGIVRSQPTLTVVGVIVGGLGSLAASVEALLGSNRGMFESCIAFVVAYVLIFPDALHRRRLQKAILSGGQVQLGRSLRPTSADDSRGDDDQVH